MAAGISQSGGSKMFLTMFSLTTTLLSCSPEHVLAMTYSPATPERIKSHPSITTPPENVHVYSYNLFNQVCWDLDRDAFDNRTFDAQYIDDKHFRQSSGTWTSVTNCTGVSGPCCTFFEDISYTELGKPLWPADGAWWVRVRAESALGPSLWTRSANYFSPYQHTVIGPPAVDVTETLANQEASSTSQIRDLSVRISHPVTPYYRYDERKGTWTSATMGDFENEGMFVYYNVSYWIHGHRENSRESFLAGNDSLLKEEYSIQKSTGTGLRPGTVYCVQVTGYVDSIWGISEGKPTRKVCKRTADGKPSRGPANITWGPLPANNCSAATRSFRDVLVEWDPVSETDSNGVITDYMVTIGHYTEQEQHQTIRYINGNTRRLNLTDLTTFNTYNISLSACTSAGCTQGEKVLHIPAHVVNAVAPTNLARAEVTSEKIAVTWLPPENAFDCVDVYKVNYTKSSGGILMQVIVTDTKAVLTELQPGTTYNISVSAVYKKLSHSPQSPQAESLPTPWVQISTEPPVSNYTLPVLVVIGVCLVILLAVTLYLLTRRLSTPSTEKHYEVLNYNILIDIKRHPAMTPITPSHDKGKRERVDSWEEEVKTLAELSARGRIHADEWHDPESSAQNRRESSESGPSSVVTSSTSLGEADPLEGNSTNEYASQGANWTTDYLVVAPTDSGHDDTIDIKCEEVKDNSCDDYVQHVSTATPGGCSAEAQSSEVVTELSDDSGLYVTSQGQTAAVRNNLSNDYAVFTTRSDQSTEPRAPCSAQGEAEIQSSHKDGPYVKDVNHLGAPKSLTCYNDNSKDPSLVFVSDLLPHSIDVVRKASEGGSEAPSSAPPCDMTEKCTDGSLPPKTLDHKPAGPEIIDSVDQISEYVIKCQQDPTDFGNHNSTPQEGTEVLTTTPPTDKVEQQKTLNVGRNGYTTKGKTPSCTRRSSDDYVQVTTV